MTDKSLIAERLNTRKSEMEPDRDEVEDFGSYGFLRGIRDRCPMLDFIQPCGDSVAFAYADLTRVVWSKQKQLELYFSNAIVSIRGKNLLHATTSMSLHAGLKLHRIPWVKAVDELKMKPSHTDTAVVTEIKIDDGVIRN